MNTIQLIGICIFVGGMIATWIFALSTGVLKFDGTRYKNRLLFSVWFCAVLSATGLCLVAPEANSLLIGAALGIMLTYPLVVLHAAWFRRHLQGHIVKYPVKHYRRSLVRSLPICFAIFVLVKLVGMNRIKEYSFVVIALCVCWFLSSLYAYVQVVRLEHEIGKEIVEESAPSE